MYTAMAKLRDTARIFVMTHLSMKMQTLLFDYDLFVRCIARFSRVYTPLGNLSG